MTDIEKLMRLASNIRTKIPMITIVNAQNEIDHLRAELAQQQAHAEAQAARIETLEEKNAKLKAALENFIHAIRHLSAFSVDGITDADAKNIGAALNQARAALAE